MSTTTTTDYTNQIRAHYGIKAEIKTTVEYGEASFAALVTVNGITEEIATTYATASKPAKMAAAKLQAEQWLNERCIELVIEAAAADKGFTATADATPESAPEVAARPSITPEINPSTGRCEFAVRIGAMHCGYAPSYLAGERLAQEIIAARADARITAQGQAVAAGFRAMAEMIRSGRANGPITVK